jgi:hypothetical protein
MVSRVRLFSYSKFVAFCHPQLRTRCSELLVISYYLDIYTTTVNYIVIYVYMDQSSAAKTILEVAASAGPRTRSQSRTRDSSLSTAPPSPAPPTTYWGKRRHVRFDSEVEAGSSNASTTIPTRSTCGKAPIRLVDQQIPPEAIPRRVTTKHRPSTQPLQPPLKGISAGRTPLCNATNTLGKKRTSSTSQKTKI